MPDFIPVLPGLFIAVVSLVAWIAIELEHSTTVSEPDLSRLDRLDGLSD